MEPLWIRIGIWNISSTFLLIQWGGFLSLKLYNNALSYRYIIIICITNIVTLDLSVKKTEWEVPNAEIKTLFVTIYMFFFFLTWQSAKLSTDNIKAGKVVLVSLPFCREFGWLLHSLSMYTPPRLWPSFPSYTTWKHLEAFWCAASSFHLRERNMKKYGEKDFDYEI